jgi:AcrR family transcriptional regulator
MVRIPQQKRSKILVKSIIEAGFISVGKYGAATTTTHHIAQIAGVSVGSVYEYFDNKEAIFDAMAQRVISELIKVFLDLSQKIHILSVEEAVYLVTGTFTEFLHANNNLYLSVAKQLINSDYDRYLEPSIQTLTDLCLNYIASHPEYMMLPNIRAVLYVIVHGSCFVVLHHLTSDKPEIDYDSMTQALGTLLTSYLNNAKRS